MSTPNADLKIADIKAYPTSFPVKPEDSVSLGVGVNEEFLMKQPVIEGPSHV